MAFSRSQVHPIGLDVGFDSVKMLQLSSSGPLLSLVAAARESLPPEVRSQPDLRMPAATQIVRRLFKEGHFSGRKVVAALPRLPNGKLDHAQLLALANSARQRASERGAQDPVERRLLAIMADTLDDETVGVDDDFFLSGGTSLPRCGSHLWRC